MKAYCYVVARDYGFAPNPFGGYCTLACCKPGIRKKAKMYDWIIGSAPDRENLRLGGHIIYAMQVKEIISFSNYWKDKRFQFKKPVMNGSLVQHYGDNIYSFDIDERRWIQADSHHSYIDGTENTANLIRDTSGKYVLISEKFWYFGRNAVPLPNNLTLFGKSGIGHKCVEDGIHIFDLEQWLQSNWPEKGLIANPIGFNNKFTRYKG